MSREAVEIIGPPIRLVMVDGKERFTRRVEAFKLKYPIEIMDGDTLDLHYKFEISTEVRSTLTRKVRVTKEKS